MSKIVKKNSHLYFRILFWLGIAVWLYGSYRGHWSSRPQSTFEEYTDTFGGILTAYGALGDIFTGLKIFKDDSVVTNVTTEKLDLHVTNPKAINFEDKTNEKK